MIGTLIFSSCIGLVYSNLSRFRHKDCASELDPRSNSNTDETLESGVDGESTKSRANICYQITYNCYFLFLIFSLTIVWLTFKVLKADMGFRCTSSPCFSTFISFIMASIRFFAFFILLLYYILPYVFMHCMYTYIVMYYWIKRTISGENASKNIQNITSQIILWDSLLHFQTVIFWTISIVVYTSLPFLAIYGCIVLKRKADFRKGWSKRLDFAVLKLVRIFMGTSRLMVVKHERFAELLYSKTSNDENSVTMKALMDRDFLDEDYSDRSSV